MASHCAGEKVGWSLVGGRKERASGVLEVEGLDWRLAEKSKRITRLLNEIQNSNLILKPLVFCDLQSPLLGTGIVSNRSNARPLYMSLRRNGRYFNDAQ